jgi:hypothetical protein
MRFNITLAIAGLVVAAAPAFAQTKTMGVPPHALGTPAPAQAALPPIAAPAMSRHGKGDNPDARLTTDALNLLESHGYAAFRDFAPEGSNFTATVTVGNNRSAVIINPDTGTISGK